MVQMRTLYNNFPDFLMIAKYIQSQLASLRKSNLIQMLENSENEEDKKKANIYKTSIIYLQNRITEAIDRIYFGKLFNEISVTADKPVNVTDLDFILSSNGTIKAFFEVKRKRKYYKDILVNWSQYNTLKQLWEKSNFDVYYIVKFGWNNFRLIKINFWERELAGKLQTRDSYVRIPYEEGIECDEAQLIANIADILRVEYD